jgi:hypothetical protein
MSRRAPPPVQLGFDTFLERAAAENLTRQIARDSAHLPAGLDEALPFFRVLIERHHAAMLAADAPLVTHLREEADRLAFKLNGFRPGILANDDSPGHVLDRETRAPDGRVPRWGQSGRFDISVGSMRVHIEMAGIFGVASFYGAWCGFAAHAIDLDKPFLSETGYRSFLGIGGDLRPGFTPDTYAKEIIASYMESNPLCPAAPASARAGRPVPPRD